MCCARGATNIAGEVMSKGSSESFYWKPEGKELLDFQEGAHMDSDLELLIGISPVCRVYGEMRSLRRNCLICIVSSLKFRNLVGMGCILSCLRKFISGLFARAAVLVK